MADASANLSRSISSRTLQQFLEVFLLGKAVHTPCLLGKPFASKKGGALE